MSVKDVFLDLVSYSTGSDETTGTTPSTPGQKVLGAHIVERMKSIGIEDAHMDELGYVYGSLLAIGYCQYLQEQRRRLGLDQLLFLARDGDILRQVYALLYPQERADLIYVPWSRSAGIQLLAEAWKPDYFRRFLTHKCNQGLTLTQVFSAMGLEGLLPLLNQERSLDCGSELTAHVETQVRSFLLDHFDQILQCYERQRAGARHLLEPWLSSSGRVGVVDIGWTGSAAIALRALGEQWGWQKEIIGFLVGSDALQDHLQGGRTCGAHALGILHSYVFSSAQNRALWKQHDPASGHNVLAELLFASPAPSLKCFSQRVRHSCAGSQRRSTVNAMRRSSRASSALRRTICGWCRRCCGSDASRAMMPMRRCVCSWMHATAPIWRKSSPG